MIPCNEENNCQDFFSTKCILWGGTSLECLGISSCPTPNIETIIETIASKICTGFSIAAYDIPVCLNSYNISDFTGMQNAMLAEICSAKAELDNTSSLNWYCLANITGDTLLHSLQTIIDNVNINTIQYNTNQFVITGSTSTCNKTLNISQGVWIDITSQVLFYVNGTTNTNFTNGTSIYYMKDATGIIHIKGALITNYVLSTSHHIFNGTSTSSVIVCDFPQSLIPLSNTQLLYDYPAICLPGFNAKNHPPANNAMPTVNGYNLTWNAFFGVIDNSQLSLSNPNSIPLTNQGGGKAFRMTVYPSYDATQGSGEGNLSIYLHSIKYSSN